MQLDESKKRMNRYRDERNTAKIMLKSLQEQILTLQNTVQQLQESRESYASGPLDTALLTNLQLTDDMTDYNPEGPQDGAYSPEEYSEQAVQGGGGGGGGGGAGAGASRRQGRQSLSATSSSG